MHRSSTRRPRTTRKAAGAVAVAVAGALALSLPAAHAAPDRHGPPGKPGKPGPTAELQVLALNDFHGALEPPSGSGGQVVHDHGHGSHETIDAGGAEYLATALREAREGHPRSVTVAAGDMVGATPLLSGMFHDEPTIEALNLMEMDVVGVGNHEFDEGWRELIRKQEGGCHPADGCYVEDREFEGADFPFLAANVVHEDTGKPVLAPYSVQNIKGVKVGFIGVTLEGTADIVTAEGIRGLEFRDEVETLNKYTEELKRKGVHAVIALVHEGGYPASTAYNHDCDADGGLSGPIVDIAENTHAGVDVLITGHTHQPYVCTIPDPAGNDRLVTSAQSNGRLVTELNMSYDRRSKDIVRASVEGTNRVVHRDHQRAADMTDLLSFWNELAAPIANRPIGWITEDITQDRNIPESPLGNLIADAQLAHAQGLDESAVLALMNPGGIRTDLTYAASGEEGDGVVTYGEGFAVQPFSNYVYLVDLSGEQLLAVLREQVSGPNLGTMKILQPSEGFAYTLDLTRSGADRIVADSVTLHGEPLEADRVYRVAVNSFLAGGGDGFPTLAEHTNPLVGGNDLEALADHLSAISSADAPITAPAADRITVLR
ncbi:5'-nucleotidase C-terminal domain-containing protein [Streptomyces sp. ACA25]|uniref:bifunctional metallophosphatase/5'-nucleotidase n=1 Tax=Streptomyces sp. ACA25 TaxID=3022596 RepID=UPI0023079FD6|nr:5'-nucleotidase C-terminal domain-containing protein [Streptomyces sp. ACA25]MDB1087987.1 5'-nucleotidase C-terminal domain-containing protein [Streptomyces sp. ACA25]